MAQKKTNKEVILTERASSETGLTPTQERAAVMLASGESITKVAEVLKIERCTIYRWQKLPTYQCYFNRRASDLRGGLVMGLYGLAEEALSTIKESLSSPNEQIRLKAAMWITEKLQEIPIGKTDIRDVLKEKCTYEDDWGFVGSRLHPEQYNKELEALGLSED